VLLSDQHNSFSDSGAKTAQTACANKWRYQWAQFILSEFSFSIGCLADNVVWVQH